MILAPFTQVFLTKIPCKRSFEGLGKKYISVDRPYNAMWTKNKRRSWVCCEHFEAILHVLLDNLFIQVGGKVFQQCVGIPMGTNSTPLLAELLLHDYESNARIRISSKNGNPQAKSFELTCRNIDDLIGSITPDSTKLSKRYLSELRGAWRDHDTNNIFAHCSLIFYFLDFKFSNFVCPSVLHRLIWFFLKKSFRKKKNIRKTTQNALAPSIFIVLSIVLKLGTPLLHTQAQNALLQNI